MIINNNAEKGETQNIAAIEKYTEDLKDKTANNKKDKNKSEKGTGANDSFQISDEAKKMFLDQLENTKEENPYTDLIKLIEIANRISKGDKVPLSDEKKLLEKEPDMYLSAKMTAEMNKNKKHKNHKPLFEEEEEGNIKEQINGLKAESDFSDYEVESGQSQPEGETTEASLEVS